jgi:uncharacterized protein (DUF1810 family)
MMPAMSQGPDPYNLHRFLEAQASVLDEVQAELTKGQKRSHWMWFVFPQLSGLGTSSMAHRYGIGSLEEASAYFAHPVLGPRLVSHTELVLAVLNSSANDIFGSPDDMKFHSSMTLFARTRTDGVFRRALERFFGGAEDGLTLERLASNSS